MSGDRQSKVFAGEKKMPDRKTLVRDVIVLQFKLVVDGLRDFVLVPVSLVAGLLSLFRRGSPSDTAFYDLLRYGRQTDRAINLFGAADRLHDPEDDGEALPDLDQLVGRMETFVADEYQRGGVTALAKERLDEVLETFRKRAARRAGRGREG